MIAKRKQHKLKLILAVVISFVPLLFALALVKNKGPTFESAIVPAQEVFKSTDQLRFVLDLGTNPKLSKIFDIEKAFAQSNNSNEYIDDDVKITANLIHTNEEIENAPTVPLNIQKESGEKYIISGDTDINNLIPGKYELQVDVEKDGEKTTFIQDFNWGVLAINTNKSIYTPEETANIAIAVLDEIGDMVCDADVDLEIISPNGETKTLSTKDQTIEVNSNCSKKEYVLEPDYETKYEVGPSGIYQMALTSVTPNGSYTITDEFEVRDYVPFDVERKTATRIYPPVDYPVNIIIKANEDFKGTIVETVPESFEIISEYSSLVFHEKPEVDSSPGIKLVQKVTMEQKEGIAKIEINGNVKTLSWDVTLLKGEEFQIDYTYRAPQISPEFYLLGPLRFISNTKPVEVFAETRKWQIAADAIAYVQSDSNATSADSRTVTLTATANSLLVFFCGVESSKTFTGPGGDWIEIYNEAGSQSQAAWYKISAGGSESPQCSWSGADSSYAALLEYSGVETAAGNILDTNNTATGSGDATVECPSVTPSAGNHVYIAGFIFDGGATRSIVSWSNSFAQREEAQISTGAPGGRIDSGVADKISTGPQSTTVTIDNSGAWRCQTLAFNEDIVTLDGRVFTDDDEGTTLNSQSVCAAINAGASPECTTTDGSGYFTIVHTTPPSAGDQLTVYLDGGTNFGNTVTTSFGVDIVTEDNFVVYENHVVVRHEQDSNITIAGMENYDNDNNATDMLFDATDDTTDTLSVEDSNELFVQAGYTFAPGGNVTSVHDIEVDGNWTAAASETVNLSGTYKLDTGGTLDPSTSTVTFDGTGGTEDIITDGTGGFYNFTVNDAGGSLTLEVEDALSVYGNLTITGGTLDVKTENNQINVGGNFDDDDLFLPRSGTVVMDGSGAATYTIDSDGSDASDNFYNITFNDAAGGATYQLLNALDVDYDLTLTGGTLDSNGSNITVGRNWTNDDTFTEGTGTVTLDEVNTAHWIQAVQMMQPVQMRISIT